MTTETKFIGVADKIKKALESRFINTDDIARIIALGAAAGKNVLLWGPAGHGKSEMVEAALRSVAASDEIHIQSFGEGMNEAHLWGGLNFKKLDTESELEFDVENSFLNKEYAVFEEIFDAPPAVIMSLKDALTARRLRKGKQQYDMKTRMIVAITNKNPREISQLGPAAHALIERFPLQFEVTWLDYNKEAYMNLFNKVNPTLPGTPIYPATLEVIATMFEEAADGGEPISPRTAIHAIGAVRSAGLLRGAKQIEVDDLMVLKYVPGLEKFSEELESTVQQRIKSAQAQESLKAEKNKFTVLKNRYDKALSDRNPNEIAKMAKEFEQFQKELYNVSITDDLVSQRDTLATDARKLNESAREEVVKLFF